MESFTTNLLLIKHDVIIWDCLSRTDDFTTKKLDHPDLNITKMKWLGIQVAIHIENGWDQPQAANDIILALYYSTAIHNRIIWENIWRIHSTVGFARLKYGYPFPPLKSWVLLATIHWQPISLHSITDWLPAQNPWRYHFEYGIPARIEWHDKVLKCEGVRRSLLQIRWWWW